MASAKGTAAYGREMTIDGKGKKATITVGPVRFRLRQWHRDGDYEIPADGGSGHLSGLKSMCEDGVTFGYNMPRAFPWPYRVVGKIARTVDQRESGTDLILYQRHDPLTGKPRAGDRFTTLAAAFEALVREYVATPTFRAWCREIDMVTATHDAEEARVRAEQQTERERNTTTEMGITITRRPDTEEPGVTWFSCPDYLYGTAIFAETTADGGCVVRAWDSMSSYRKDAWVIGTVVRAGPTGFAVVTEMEGVFAQIAALRFTTANAAVEYLLRERVLLVDRWHDERRRTDEAERRAKFEAEQAKLNAHLAAKTAERDTYAARFAAAGGA